MDCHEFGGVAGAAAIVGRLDQYVPILISDYGSQSSSSSDRAGHYLLSRHQCTELSSCEYVHHPRNRNRKCDVAGSFAFAADDRFVGNLEARRAEVETQPRRAGICGSLPNSKAMISCFRRSGAPGLSFRQRRISVLGDSLRCGVHGKAHEDDSGTLTIEPTNGPTRKTA